MDTKSREKSTFLDVLIQVLTKQNPELLHFEAELLNVPLAAKCTFLLLHDALALNFKVAMDSMSVHRKEFIAELALLRKELDYYRDEYGLDHHNLTR